MPNCNTCTKNTDANNNVKDVPYIVYEGAQVRNERIIKRLIWSLIVAVGLLFLTNGIWILYLNQYDYSSYSVDVDSDDGGNANYIGNDGDIYNGTGISPKENAD